LPGAAALDKINAGLRWIQGSSRQSEFANVASNAIRECFAPDAGVGTTIGGDLPTLGRHT
jgi:hypothetical protein